MCFVDFLVLLRVVMGIVNYVMGGVRIFKVCNICLTTKLRFLEFLSGETDKHLLYCPMILSSSFAQLPVVK